ncbi:MAG: N-acetylmuramoyl-L-alanine amidase [bacterium]
MARRRTDYIFWHTSATAGNGDASAETMRRYHLSKGWSDIGYHYIVRQDGTIEEGRAETAVGAHVEGVNRFSVGICFSGHGDEADHTAVQRSAGLALTRRLMKKYGVPAENVLGHREVNALVREGKVDSKYRTSKSCPGSLVDMNDVRAELRSSTRLPVDLGHGHAVDEVNVEQYYTHTERDTSGGYYPIGSNQLWHGGLHIHAVGSAHVVAMYPGRIIAVRLGDDASGRGPLGSRNFILMRHTVSGTITAVPPPGDEPVTYVVRAPQLNLRAEAGTQYTSLGKLTRGDVLERLERLAGQSDGYAWMRVTVTSSATAGLAGKTGYVAEEPRFVTLTDPPAVPPVAGGAAATETFYSLYMHLAALPLDPTSAAIAPFTWLPRRVTGLTITGRRVHLRDAPDGGHLAFIGEGESVSVVDEAPRPAGGHTWYRVRRSADVGGEEGYVAFAEAWAVAEQTPDPAFVERVRGGGVVRVGGDADGGVAVRGGAPLWPLGCYGHPDPVPTLHWEVFSEKCLLPAWERAQDDDEDLTLDVRRILDALGFEPLLPEQRLTADEVDAFYRSDIGPEMRAICCRFISEWAVDLDAIPDGGAGLFLSEDIKSEIEPYLWWREAEEAGVPLPSDARVWHYNPVAFTRVLHALAGPPVEPHAALEQDTQARHYSLKHGVTLEPGVEAEVDEVADAFFAQSGRDIVITSNMRTPMQQADAMYPKFSSGEVWRLYRNRNLLNEINAAYVNARGQPKTVVVDAMTRVIQSQVERGAYISRHLKAGAIDVRSKTLSAREIEIFMRVVREQGHHVIKEGDHLHLEFKRDRRA